MRPPVPSRLRLAALAAFVCTCAPPALAALTENLTTSVTAMALGNAVTADPPGIDSIHFNPAGLARMTGDSQSFTLFGASIRSAASFHAPPGFDVGGWTDDPVNNTSSGPVKQAMVIPILGMRHWRLPGVVIPGLGLAFNKPGSPFTFGTNTYMTQAMSIDRTFEPDDPARFQGRQVQLQRLVYAAPALGYKYSETLRFGVAVPIAHAAFVIDTDMRFPNTLLGIVGKLQQGWCPNDGGNILDTLGFGLCGGGKNGMITPFKKAANMRLEMTAPYDPTLNLGVLWEPKPWFGLGAAYQGGSNTQYTGTYTFTTEPMLRSFINGLNSGLLGPIAGAVLGFPVSIPQVQKGNLTATIPFPTHVQIGVKLKPVKYVQLNVDASYAKWGDWNSLSFQFDQSIRLLEIARLYGIPNSGRLTIPRGYKSVLNFGYGLQLFPTDKLTLRFGYEPRKSSVPGDKIDLIAPLPDTKLYGLGLNYQLTPNSDISVSASYMVGRYKVPANTDCNINCNNFLNVIYNPYAGLDVSGDIRVRYGGINYTRHF
ncbi:long-subunit fatty acid transport protein [Oxalobacteraceae bacterium GrIS 1.11]